MSTGVPPAPQEAAWRRWLCGDASDRARFHDMSRRFRRAHVFGLAVGGTCLLTARWYGVWLAVLVVLASLTMAVSVGVGRRVQQREPLAAVTFLLLQLNLAVSVALSGGASSPLLPLMVVPVFNQAVCFRHTVIRAGVVLSAVLAAGSVVVAPAVPAAPAVLHLVAYLALLACLSLAAAYLAESDRVTRDEALLDPLTGLLNRKSLRQRFRSARAQALRLGGSVSVVLCDLDHFKRINDTHGHGRGDEVLQEVAYVLRKGVRTYDAVYRLGGEEFLVLLPGFDHAAAVDLAEQMRAEVQANPMGGTPVTLSSGVATTSGGEIELAELIAAADAALYRAKEAGRNRVESAATGTGTGTGTEVRVPAPRDAISGASAMAAGPAPPWSATGSPGSPAG